MTRLKCRDCGKPDTLCDVVYTDGKISWCESLDGLFWIEYKRSRIGRLLHGFYPAIVCGLDSWRGWWNSSK